MLVALSHDCSIKVVTALLQYLDLLCQRIGQIIDILTPGTNKGEGGQ